MNQLKRLNEYVFITNKGQLDWTRRKLDDEYLTKKGLEERNSQLEVALSTEKNAKQILQIGVAY